MAGTQPPASPYPSVPVYSMPRGGRTAEAVSGLRTSLAVEGGDRRDRMDTEAVYHNFRRRPLPKGAPPAVEGPPGSTLGGRFATSVRPDGMAGPPLDRLLPFDSPGPAHDPMAAFEAVAQGRADRRRGIKLTTARRYQLHYANRLGF